MLVAALAADRPASPLSPDFCGLPAATPARRGADRRDRRPRLPARRRHGRARRPRPHVRPAPAALARHDLCRDLPRHLGAGPALLAVLRAAAVRRHPRRPSSSPSSRSASTSAPMAPRSCAAPSSAVPRGQWEATTALNMTRGRGAPPHHPAAGLRRDDPALGQSLHRAPQGDLARLADHPHRPHLQGADS